jgi:hypothetical protein
MGMKLKETFFFEKKKSKMAQQNEFFKTANSQFVAKLSGTGS